MNIRKKVRRTYKKVKRFFKRYIRLLVRHTKAKDYSVLMYTIFGLAAIILIISLIVSLISSIFKKDDHKKTTTESTQSEEISTSEEIPSLNKEAQEIYNANKDFLILVNYDNPLDKDYTFTHHTLNCGLDVDERIYSDMLAMLTDLNGEDLHYTILSAYRSREVQDSLVKNSVSEYISQGMTEDEAYTETYKSIQHPGTSEHETGLCFDIVSEGVYELDDSVANYETNQWLMEHCYEYGFILRYPLDKESITGITYEPWHFRYVGKEAALFIKENNLTLEEFYELLEG